MSLQGQNYLVVTEKILVINGKTSLGKFSCAYENGKDQDTVQFARTTEYSVRIPVDSFGCGNRMLDRDFAKTLRAEEYPFIEVLLEDFESKNSSYSGVLNLRLLGKELEIASVNFMEKESDSGKLLTTNLSIGLTQFQINPPKKFFGLLKIQDELKIELQFKVN